MTEYHDPYAIYKDKNSAYYSGNEYGENWFENAFGAKAIARRKAREEELAEQRANNLGTSLKVLPRKPASYAEEMTARQYGPKMPNVSSSSEPETLKLRSVGSAPADIAVKQSEEAGRQPYTSKVLKKGRMAKAIDAADKLLDVPTSAEQQDKPNWFDNFAAALAKAQQGERPRPQPTTLIAASAGNGGQGGSLSGVLSEEARAKQAMPTYYDKFTALFK